MVLDGKGSVYGDTGWDLMVLGYYKLVLLVSIGLLCLYILKKIEIRPGDTDPSDRQQNIMLLSLSHNRFDFVCTSLILVSLYFHKMKLNFLYFYICSSLVPLHPLLCNFKVTVINRLHISTSFLSCEIIHYNTLQNYLNIVWNYLTI